MPQVDRKDEPPLLISRRGQRRRNPAAVRPMHGQTNPLFRCHALRRSSLRKRSVALHGHTTATTTTTAQPSLKLHPAIRVAGVDRRVSNRVRCLEHVAARDLFGLSGSPRLLGRLISRSQNAGGTWSWLRRTATACPGLISRRWPNRNYLSNDRAKLESA